MRIKYSPSAAEKLKFIKATGGIKVVDRLTQSIKSLKEHPEKGASVERMTGISTAYYYLHVVENYVFYRIDKNNIYIVDIYNEREDFMWKMFGISLRTQESIDYWGE